VATLAGRSIPVQASERAAVNARGEFLDLAVVAGGAKCPAARGRLYNLMGIAMASHAGFGIIRLAKRRVSASPQLAGDFPVAGKARGRCAFCGMRDLSCPSMAIHTAKILVDAMRERLRLDGDRLALRVR